MVPLENLVVCIANDPEVLIYEPLVNGGGDGMKVDLFFEVLEYGIEPFQLRRVFRK